MSLGMARMVLLRVRKGFQHRDSSDVPSTQPLVVKGLLIRGLFEFVSIVCLVLWLAGHS
jgi:hypothetical protein